MTDSQPAYQHFLGIDVSKHTLDVCLVCLVRGVGTEKHHHQLANDEAGFARLIQWLAQHQAPPEATIICMENTGLYDDALLEAMTLSGYSCAVEKTTVLQKVRPEHHRKDDRFDAALLAEYAYRFQDKLCLWTAPEPVIEEIRLLYRERRRLITQRGAVLQLQSEAPRRTSDTGFAEALWHEQIAFFNEHITRIEEQLEALVRSDEAILRRYEIVKSLPGFGSVASLLFVMLFYGEDHLKAREIASRFGFAPHGERSGTSQYTPARSSGHGQSEVRKVLTLCARSAGTHDPKLRAYKQKKLAEGKASKLVTNNMINRLLGIVCALWNDNAYYDPDHVSRFAQKAALST